MKQFFTAITLIFFIILLNSCHVARYIVWNFADINDVEKFPVFEIDKSKKTFRFHKNNPLQTQNIADINIDNNIQTLEEFLEDNRTAAFLVIKNDTLKYEKYFEQYNEESIFPSFSISKSFFSALVGIAISEGYINSVNQPITDYLSCFKDDRFKNIKIKHLINMRSGIEFNESYLNPFGDVAKYYYGKNLRKYISRLKIKEDPGEKFEYTSVNTIILGLIIEKATGMKNSVYLEKKIWQPLQMEYDATLSLDSKKHQTTKAFCCLNARARDFAKFGRLYLNKGYWNGRQILPEEWVNKSTNFSEAVLKKWSYQYNLWTTQNNAFFMIGILGQYIYVDPNAKIIIVRIGESSAKVDWINVFENIVRKI